MSILSVQGLTKKYPEFTLDNVSFEVQEGTIMGFIGRNGAGKTTTLKSVLGLVHADSGSVQVFGKDFYEHEEEAKQNMGFVFGGVDYYSMSKLKDIAKVTSRFYGNWDNAVFDSYLRKFNLSLNKRIKDLSEGMKVKFALAMALSHGARLFLLDEPTSGLDPVSRDELIGTFIDLVSDGECSILFSTHIISDLEKCADYITYIKDGKILSSTDKDSFADKYRAVRGDKNKLNTELLSKLIGKRDNMFGFEAMIEAKDEAEFTAAGLEVELISLEDIMIHIERE